MYSTSLGELSGYLWKGTSLLVTNLEIPMSSPAVSSHLVKTTLSVKYSGV
jgi:hypothetical protein